MKKTAIALVLVAAGMRVVGVVAGNNVLRGLPQNRTSIGAALVDTASEIATAVGIAATGTILAALVGGSITTITLDSPGAHPFDVGTNHSSAEYQNSVQTQLQDPTSQLSQYSNDPSLLPFLTGDPEAVQHFLSGVHREH